MTKLITGTRWYCIEDYVMDNGRIAFTKGESYLCKNDNCLTNNDGNDQHYMDDEDFNLYFLEQVKGVKNDSDKLPYYTVLFKQFPLALQEVMKCSKAGNQKYHETDKDWQNFSRLENADSRYKDAMLRHMTEEGQIEDMIQYGEITHEGAVVWNALADLEIKLRNK